MTPDRQEILRRVQEAIRMHMSFGPEVPVPPDADFFAQFGGDSLDLAEITMRLEEEFDISAPESALPPPITPGKIVSMVEQALAPPRLQD
jgi:acyl carrier protein